MADRIAGEPEPTVTITVEMTPEQYVLIKRNAAWQHMTVTEYLLDNALQNYKRSGC